METVGSLQLRKFKVGPNGSILESTKDGAPEAAHISYETYKQSKRYFSQTGAQQVPFNGHELMEDVLDRVNNYMPDKNCTFQSITVYKNHLDIHGYTEHISRNNENQALLTPDVPVSELAFSRLIAKLPLLGDERYQATLAIKWQPNYCQVALGTNVRICDNYNIFSNRLWSTSTKLKLNYDTLMTYMDKELKGIEDQFGTDIKTIGSLIDTPLNEKSVKLLIGDMSMRYAEDNKVLPITDLNQMVRNIVADRKEGRTVENMWDFTNAGTRALHFNKNSGDTTLDTISKFNNYVLEMQGKHKRN